MDAKLLSLLDRLDAFGRDNDHAQTNRANKMLNITPETGRLLWILATSMRAQRVLEIGTSNALSTIWLADAARLTGGTVVTLERSPAKIDLARANLTEAGLASLVHIEAGDALDTLRRLTAPFDLVFLDADRPRYLAYLDAIVPLLRPGGLLVTDNVVSHATELAPFLDRVKTDPRLFSVTLPVGKGEELSYRL